MKKIGLTGVIGAGKSSVIQILKQENITVVDCDVINAQLLRKGNTGYIAILKEFGSCLLNDQKEIDARAMSRYIFADIKRKQRAERVLHSLIKEQIVKQLEEHEAEPLVVVEVPLLFEIKWESFFDEVWVVACDEILLLQRLALYRGIDVNEAKLRLSHQMSQQDKIKKADIVFYNNADKEALKQQIYDILNVEIADRGDKNDKKGR